MSALQHPSFEIPCCTRLSAGRLALALESLAPLCPCSAQTPGVVTRALDATPRSQSAFGVRVRRPPSAYAGWSSRRSLACRDRNKGVQPGKRHKQAKDRGPVRVSGLNKGVESLKAALDEAEEQIPDAVAALKTVGMLCVRVKRTNPNSFSNHSWGTALDLFFGSAVIPQGKPKTYRGILQLVP